MMQTTHDPVARPRARGDDTRRTDTRPMPTRTRPDRRRTDSDADHQYRPPYIRIGLDCEGISHCYHTPTESIFQITSDGEIHDRLVLGGDTVRTYMRAVENSRGGWTIKHYGFDNQLEALGEAVKAALGEAEDGVGEGAGVATAAARDGMGGAE